MELILDMQKGLIAALAPLILRKQCVNKLFQLGGFSEFHRE